MQAIGAGIASSVRILDLSVDQAYVQRHFAPLLHTQVKAGVYHVFISYRHGEFANVAADTIYSTLSRQLVGTQKIAVFRDSVKLKSGLEFDKSFMEAMLRSLVVVPIITPDTFKRMESMASLEAVDHVLLEWWLAFTLLDAPGYVRRMAPILCGTVSSFPVYCLQSLVCGPDVSRF